MCRSWGYRTLPATRRPGSVTVTTMSSEASTTALADALGEARLLAAARPWTLPAPATEAEAAQLLVLLAANTALPAPEIEAQPDGALHFNWEAGERGWVTLSVDGHALLTHSAVIDGDEYTLAEPWDGQSLTDWAAEVLRRLWVLPAQPGRTGDSPGAQPKAT